MKKKHSEKMVLFLLLFCFLLGACASPAQEESSHFSVYESEGEDILSRAEPEIFYCRVSEDLEPGQKIDQGIHLLGKQFLDSRVGTQEEAEEKTEKYGYCLQSYWDYGVGRIYDPVSPTFSEEEAVQDMTVQRDGRTWIVAYTARISRWGRFAPVWSGPKFEGSEWTFDDWWIIHQEDTLFSMMSYTDYQRIQETKKDDAENPFMVYPAEPEEIPESDYWKYDCNDLMLTQKNSSTVFYYEPLQIYLYNSALIYEYEADTEDSSKESVEAAALRLGQLYLEELRSRDYDPWMGEKFIRPRSRYYLKDFKDLQLYRLESSLDLTEEKMAEKAEYPDLVHDRYNNVPSDCFIPGELSSMVLKADKNIWVADYGVLVKSDDPTWGITMTETGEYVIGEEFKPSADAALRMINFIIFKKGNRYFMVSPEDIVTKSELLQK